MKKFHFSIIAIENLLYWSELETVIDFYLDVLVQAKKENKLMTEEHYNYIIKSLNYLRLKLK